MLDINFITAIRKAIQTYQVHTPRIPRHRLQDIADLYLILDNADMYLLHHDCEVAIRDRLAQCKSHWCWQGKIQSRLVKMVKSALIKHTGLRYDRQRLVNLSNQISQMS